VDKACWDVGISPVLRLRDDQERRLYMQLILSHVNYKTPRSRLIIEISVPYLKPHNESYASGRATAALLGGHLEIARHYLLGWMVIVCAVLQSYLSQNKKRKQIVPQHSKKEKWKWSLHQLAWLAAMPI